VGIVFALLTRRCCLRLDLEELIAGAGNGLFDDVAFDIERWIFVGADHSDRVPRGELRRQLLAAGLPFVARRYCGLWGRGT
jgi:hypothetical protein